MRISQTPTQISDWYDRSPIPIIEHIAEIMNNTAAHSDTLYTVPANKVTLITLLWCQHYHDGTAVYIPIQKKSFSVYDDGDSLVGSIDFMGGDYGVAKGEYEKSFPVRLILPAGYYITYSWTPLVSGGVVRTEWSVFGTEFDAY